MFRRLSRLARSVLVFAALALVLGLFAVPRVWLVSNDVTTGQHPAYPDLQDRRYALSPDETLTTAANAARRLPRWRVAAVDLDNGMVRVEVRTAIGGFTDDLTIRVAPEGPRGDASHVSIRSRSRVGRGDLGENARHIRALQAAMDMALPRAR